MKYLLSILFLLVTAATSSGTIEILSERSYPIELSLSPVRIEGYQLLESGGIRISVIEGSYRQSISWIIETDSLGNTVSIDVDSLYNLPVLSMAEFPGLNEMWMVAGDERGDTLWKCPLEGTDISFFDQPMIIELPDGGYLVKCSPDCQTNVTDIQRISIDGEMLWHLSLGTNYLLDLPEPDGEIYPFVECMRETSSGDLLVGGSVSQWLTSADACFVTLIDGSNGMAVWKTLEYALGEARILDVIETVSGYIVAVGETAESVSPQNQDYCFWGAKQPLLSVLNDEGTLLNLEVLNLERTDSFKSIIELEDHSTDGNEFLIAGVDSSTCELVLIRVCLTNIE